MTFALFVVPIVLLLIGFPIFMVLLTGVTVALVFFMHVPLVVVHQNLFGSIGLFGRSARIHILGRMKLHSFAAGQIAAA